MTLSRIASEPPDQSGILSGFPRRRAASPLFQCHEGTEPEHVLLENLNEAFGAAMPSGARTKAGGAANGSPSGALYAEKGKFLLKGVGHVLAAVVMPDSETLSHILGKAAEVPAWMPTHSAERWSTAKNTATGPSPTVVPHMVSIFSGIIVPSWLRGHVARRCGTGRASRFRALEKQIQLQRAILSAS